MSAGKSNTYSTHDLASRKNQDGLYFHLLLLVMCTCMFYWSDSKVQDKVVSLSGSVQDKVVSLSGSVQTQAVKICSDFDHCFCGSMVLQLPQWYSSCPNGATAGPMVLQLAQWCYSCPNGATAAPMVLQLAQWCYSWPNVTEFWLIIVTCSIP